MKHVEMEKVGLSVENMMKLGRTEMRMLRVLYDNRLEDFHKYRLI